MATDKKQSRKSLLQYIREALDDPKTKGKARVELIKLLAEETEKVRSQRAKGKSVATADKPSKPKARIVHDPIEAELLTKEEQGLNNFMQLLRPSQTDSKQDA